MSEHQPNPAGAAGGLLPCPFCGGTDFRIETEDVQPDNYWSGFVQCTTCDASGPEPDEWLGSDGEAEQAAGEFWNRRAAASAQATGWVDQHSRDSMELRKLCEARDQARRTAEYWKAEHNAANARISELEAQLATVAPAVDAQAIRREALEQAAKVCDEYGDLMAAEKDSALLVGKVSLSNAMSGEPRAAEYLAAAIRALSKNDSYRCKDE